jgi:hypothetical protein
MPCPVTRKAELNRVQSTTVYGFVTKGIMSVAVGLGKFKSVSGLTVAMRQDDL